MITADRIQYLIRQGEGYKVDFKSAVPAKVRELSEEVCSFANAGGGFIFIGVDDKGKIIGCNITNSKRSAISDTITEISPQIDFEMYSADIEGKTVWVIDIPAGKDKLRVERSGQARRRLPQPGDGVLSGAAMRCLGSAADGRAVPVDV